MAPDLTFKVAKGGPGSAGVVLVVLGMVLVVLEVVLVVLNTEQNTEHCFLNTEQRSEPGLLIKH